MAKDLERLLLPSSLCLSQLEAQAGLKSEGLTQQGGRQRVQLIPLPIPKGGRKASNHRGQRLHSDSKDSS